MSRRFHSNQSVATKLSWRSIVFLRSYRGQLSALSRCFTASTLCFYGAHVTLKITYMRGKDPIVSQTTPCNIRSSANDNLSVRTATSVRPLCEPAELLWCWRRLGCICPMCAIWHAHSMRSVCVYGDDTSFLRRSLWSYYAHLGVMHFSRTPWYRSPSVTGILMNTDIT